MQESKKTVSANGISKEDFENMLKHLINTHTPVEKPKMHINGVWLLGLGDEDFKAFYGSDNVICTTSVTTWNEIKERAKKLGLKEI